MEFYSTGIQVQCSCYHNPLCLIRLFFRLPKSDESCYCVCLFLEIVSYRSLRAAARFENPADSAFGGNTFQLGRIRIDSVHD